MTRLFLFAIALSFPFAQATAEVITGKPLPPLTIEARGELLLEQGEYRFTPWQLPGGLGKPHIVQYMPGTMKARDQTRPFTDALEEQIPYDKIHMTSVINLDQAMWGTTGFVIGKLESNKERYPASTIVLDEEGLGQQAWALSPKQAVVVILDAGGSVLFFKEGAFSEQDIEETLSLLRQMIE
jgi:YtfJ family uncharacterized protein